ncbi:unnamed protein product, partial [Meganyctiphanes norvegica]
MSEQPRFVANRNASRCLVRDISQSRGRPGGPALMLPTAMPKRSEGTHVVGRPHRFKFCATRGGSAGVVVGERVRQTTKLKLLLHHYQKVHGERTFACECLSSFSTASLLVQHKRLCGIQMMCSCDRSFGSLESLQTHIRRDNHIIHPNTTEAIQIRKMMQPTKSSPCINKKFGSNGNTNKRTGFVPILPAGPKIYTSNCSTPIQIASSCLNSVASVHLPPTSIAQVN